MNQNLVKLSDLMIRPFYICLTKEYRQLLIQKALGLRGDLKQISQYVGCHPDTLKNFINYDEVSISSQYLINLLNLVKVSHLELEQHICHIKRGCSNRAVKIKFPIKATPELSLLIAKTCGDGSVLSDWRFHYTNSQWNLIEEVVAAVRTSIGDTKPTIHERIRLGKTFEVKFSPVIGFILHFLGAPKGYKMNQSYSVPDWIMTGSLEIKSAFIRGLFDDESTVGYRDASRRIVLCLGKKQQYKQSLELFLQQVRMLLFDFGIESNQLRVQTTYEDKLMTELAIYRKENLKKFLKYIGFSHQNKNNLLKEIVSSFPNRHVTRDSILSTVCDSQVPLTTKQIAEINNVSYNATKSHLSNFHKEGLIKKIKSYRNAWTN